MNHPALGEFLDRLSEHDGFQPLSDAKIASLSDDRKHVVIAEDDRLVAVGCVVTHRHVGGSHVAIETAVEPSMRFPAFEVAILEATVAIAPKGQRVSAWSQHRSTDRALNQIGYETRRSLHYMSVVLPLSSSLTSADGATALRSYEPGDEASIISVNNDAFRAHWEAGQLSVDDMNDLTSAKWFDTAGLLVAEDETAIIGFCWTRLHPNGDGEIFRLAVDPSHQGEGLGRNLVEAGFAYLSGAKAVTRGTLWVDADNTQAMALYQSIGMEVDRTNREFEPMDQPKR